jgi:aspartate/methionine/tyrosine aminotransferase
LVLPENLVRPFERLSQSLYISVPELSQRAAVAAFESHEEMEAVKEGYRRSRAALLAQLPEIGFDELLPVDGAFYVYASVARFTNDALDFAGRMLRQAGVAAAPGLDFDHARGNRYMRFSFAGTEADIIEGIDRLARWLK